MGLRWQEVVGVSVIIPVLSLVALWAARRIGRWFTRSVSRSFAEVVLEVMAPDMAHLSTKVTGAIDDLNHMNTVQHAKVQGELVEVKSELVGVKGRVSDVESRMAKVEALLNIRPPDARTRATDTEEL